MPSRRAYTTESRRECRAPHARDRRAAACQAPGMPAAATGTALLPLHGGRVPAWLAARMARLGRVIVETIAHEYGRTEVLCRLSSPFWFQSFGAVMGMDWHSSGITTSVIGALKRGLLPLGEGVGLRF